MANKTMTIRSDITTTPSTVRVSGPSASISDLQRDHDGGRLGHHGDAEDKRKAQICNALNVHERQT